MLSLVIISTVLMMMTRAGDASRNQATPFCSLRPWFFRDFSWNVFNLSIRFREKNLVLSHLFSRASALWLSVWLSSLSQSLKKAQRFVRFNRIIVNKISAVHYKGRAKFLLICSLTWQQRKRPATSFFLLLFFLFDWWNRIDHFISWWMILAALFAKSLCYKHRIFKSLAVFGARGSENLRNH